MRPQHFYRSMNGGFGPEAARFRRHTRRQLRAVFATTNDLRPRVSPRLAPQTCYFYAFVHFFPSFSYEFDSRYPLQITILKILHIRQGHNPHPLRPLYHKFAMLCGKKSETLGRACGKPSCRFSDIGIQQQNGVIERDKGSLRDEPLKEKLFDTLDEACRKQAHWRYGNNRVSSHPLAGKKHPWKRVKCLNNLRVSNKKRSPTKQSRLCPPKDLIKNGSVAERQVRCKKGNI